MKKIYTLVLGLICMSCVVAQTPYAWYPLDGNANDVSGHNLNGTIHGTPTATSNRFGEPTGAMSFNGSTDYIQLPEDFDFATKTIIVWSNYTSGANLSSFTAVYCSENNGTQNGRVTLGPFYNGTSNTVGASSDQHDYYARMNSNFWYQQAIVRTPTSVKHYLNGVLVYEGTSPNGAHSGNGSTSALIGSDRNYNQMFKGKIDDLKIYNEALPDSSIYADYNSGSYRYNDEITHIFDTTHVSISVTDTLYIDANSTGINSPGNNNTLKVFPNPAKDHIYINTGNFGAMNGYNIKIVNSLGQEVFSSPIDSQQFYIDLASWSGAGTYVLEILDPQSLAISTKTLILTP